MAADPNFAGFIDDYNAAFPDAPIAAGDLTSAELALSIKQGPHSHGRSSQGDLLNHFGLWLANSGRSFLLCRLRPETPIDLNGNGTPDCLDSFAGYNSVFGQLLLGLLAAVVSAADGSYAVNEMGWLLAASTGSAVRPQTLLERSNGFLAARQKIAINVNARYDLTDSVRAFAELKWVDQSTDTGGFSNSFWDLLYGAADNPYLPEFIADVAAGYGGGVALTVDPIYFGAERRTDRETVRAVFGIEGRLRQHGL